MSVTNSLVSELDRDTLGADAGRFCEGRVALCVGAPGNSRNTLLDTVDGSVLLIEGVPLSCGADGVLLVDALGADVG